MRVIRAEAMGLCFGVRDALTYIDRIAEPRRVTVYGELVHNEKVNRRLERRGFRLLREDGREAIEALSQEVLLTAHGVSNRERRRLAATGRVIHDTTCPLVRRAHQAVLALDAAGYMVLLIGRRGHVEARGLTGDAANSEIVQSATEVRSYEAEKIGIVCQTTTPDSIVRDVLKRVYALNRGKEIRFIDTVCRPTRDRQRALDTLLPQVDVLVVVGSRKSRNSCELVEKALSRGIKAYRVDCAAELDPSWFEGCMTAGLTAGTSTLDETIDEVHRALLAISQETMFEAIAAGETARPAPVPR